MILTFVLRCVSIIFPYLFSSYPMQPQAGMYPQQAAAVFAPQMAPVPWHQPGAPMPMPMGQQQFYGAAPMNGAYGAVPYGAPPMMYAPNNANYYQQIPGAFGAPAYGAAFPPYGAAPYGAPGFGSLPPPPQNNPAVQLFLSAPPPPGKPAGWIPPPMHAAVPGFPLPMPPPPPPQ
jgi:hypothetical protein